MKHRFLILTLSAVFASVAEVAATGEWFSHFSYLDASLTVETPNKVFAVADHHLFSVGKEDGEVETYTKVDGMSGNEVQYLAYGWQRHVLVIVYQDGDIDLLTDKGILYNLPDLADKQMAVVKTVNDITFHGDFAYLSCGFGVMVLNLAKFEIADTYYIGPAGTIAAVSGTQVQGDSIYALTAEGVLCAPLTGANLNDFNYWRQAYTLPSENACRMRFMNGRLYVADRNNLYGRQDDGWQVVEAVGNDSLYLEGDDRNLYLSLGAAGFLHITASGGRQHLSVPAASGFGTGDGRYFIASFTQSLLELDADRVLQVYRPSGPYVSTCQYLTYADDRIWMVPGGSWTDRLRYMAEVAVCDRHVWSNYTFEGIESYVEWMQDVVSVAVDPKDGSHAFFATWGEGVFEMRDGRIVQHYTDANSTIEKVADSPHYIRCDGLQYDKDGNLWVLNSGTSVISPGLFEVRSIKVLTKDGQWLSLECLRNENLLRRLVITRKGQKWFVAVRYTPGIYVMDDGGTLADTSDDRIRKFVRLQDQDGNDITITYAYDIVEDQDGTLWAATDAGLLTFYQPADAFKDDYTCTRVKIAREDGSGLADYLLDGVSVRSLAVDPANRKWVGTDNAGVYLLSPDGTKTIAHFTKDNSPMSSNQVNAITVNARTGEVFLAVTGGMLSYQGDALQPVAQFDRKAVQVWPNPVRPDYEGDILISGLEKASLVRITNASGQVVFEGRSQGGSVVWDGRNAEGRPVSGGMYFVLAINSDEENNRGVAAKIMIIR
ncbi:MAG: hypothetical protein J6Z12_05400 [Paludibacteraceae bacterium]|nr:hypothetical protein [Paludibacteraceae bacterium]